MKFANLLNAFGAIAVIIYSVMRILHLGLGEINLNVLLTLGFILSFIGQSWKIKILEKQIKEYNSR